MNWRSIRNACSPENVLRYLKTNVVAPSESNAHIVYSIMLGAFLATSPFWGIQSFLCVGIAMIFRLNKVLSTAVASLNFPFIPLILYTSYLIGCLVLNQPVSLDKASMDTSMLQSILVPYLIGSLILSTSVSLFLGLVFRIILHFTRKRSTKTA